MTDMLRGVLMALSIALVPNLLLALGGPDTPSGQKLALVGLFATGAVVISAGYLVIVKILGQPLTIQDESAPGLARQRRGLADLGGGLLPWKLVVAGLFASAYFLAVSGLEGKGLGAGVAETFDSGLAPCFYLAIFYWTTRKRRFTDSEQPTTPILPLRVSGGVLLILCGLIGLGAQQATWDAETNALAGDIVLLACAVVGAAGTALALWLFRRLVRIYKAPISFAVICRYGGVAVVYVLAAGFLGGYSELEVTDAALAFAVGGALINLVFVFATQITSEHVTGAALGLVPVLTFVIECGLHNFNIIQSPPPCGAPTVWLSVLVTIVGIRLLQKEPASSAVPAAQIAG